MARNASRVSRFRLSDLIAVAQRLELRNYASDYLAQTQGRVVESFVFAILTVNENTRRAEAALWAWKVAGMPRSEEAIRRICGEHSPLVRVEGEKSNKARYIADWLERYDSDPQVWHQQPAETAREYRDRVLRMGVKGLALTKVTWAVQLASGGGDIACIDRHMHLILTGVPYTNALANMKRKANIQRYMRLERILVWLANRYGWPSASALQWTVWCQALKENYTHSVVWEVA